MGPGEERGLDPPAGFTVQQPRRLVAVRLGAQLARGSDCPYCAGRKVLAGFNDLATRYPELAQTWDPVLNGALTPAMVTPGSHKKVWWRCPENHVWKAVVYSRTSDKRCGCPVCAGKVSQKNLGRYQVPLVPGGAEKAPE
ncbi:MAG: zinc-ribbon domain-containing protein [Evtepia gabavorous]|nr:zinc-ribbon domain-containing protein [Evtepia gabavorous]MEE0067677.1 zinc-ribbon domain-containing protein [Evtepia gabavorous]